MQINKTTPLSEVLKLGKNCERKNNCCKHGSGFLIGEDLNNLASHLKITKKELKEKYLEEKELFNKKLFRPRLKSSNIPYGECIFFSGKGCKVHDAKPLQCRIGNCGEHGELLSIWFMLNYVIDANDPEAIRQYAAYLNSGGKTIEGGKLEELVPDKECLKKILSFEILK